MKKQPRVLLLDLQLHPQVELFLDAQAFNGPFLLAFQQWEAETKKKTTEEKTI